MVTLLLGAVIYVVVLSLQYSDNKDFATGLLGKDAVFAVDALGVDALGKGALLGAARNNGTGANTRLFSAWLHAAFPPYRSEVLPCAPLPAPDSSQPANRLPFLNIDGCVAEQGGHCPVTGENRSKSLAGEGAAGVRTGRAAVVRFTTW